jgi:hypothetical protein
MTPKRTALQVARVPGPASALTAGPHAGEKKHRPSFSKEKNTEPGIPYVFFPYLGLVLPALPPTAAATTTCSTATTTFALLWLHRFRVGSKWLDSLGVPSAISKDPHLKSPPVRPLLAAWSFWRSPGSAHFGCALCQTTRIQPRNYPGTLCSQE